MKNITIIIESVAKEYVEREHISLAEINNGLCEEFAIDVITEMGGYSSELYETCTEAFRRYKCKLPGHVFLVFKGKYYDAETSHGVTAVSQLPLFQRHLKNKTEKIN